MRIFKKIVIWTFGVFLFLIGTGILLAWIFEDEIHLYAIRQLGKTLNARIEVRDTELSFFRSFPKVNVDLKDLKINAVNTEDPVDFITVESASFQVNFWSFFSQRYEIAGVKLKHPNVQLVMRKTGKWNFEGVFLQEPDSTGKTQEELVLELRKVALDQGKFSWKDERTGFNMAMDSIDLDLSGDISSRDSDLELDFRFFFDHLREGGVNYVDRRWVNADMDVVASYAGDQRYDLKSAKVRFASLAMDVSGFVAQHGKELELDLAYVTNENTFDRFLGLLPGKWLDTGREYTYNGDFTLNGWVRGNIAKDQMPDIFMDYGVRNGEFQYVGYRSKITEANVKGAFLWKPKTPQLSYFRVEEMTAKLNEQEVTGNFDYTNFSDPSIKLAANGQIKMEDIRDFYPAFADSSELTGKMVVDVKANGQLADFKGRNYAAVTASGSMDFMEINVKDPRLSQPISHLNGKVEVDNHQILVHQLSAVVGTSDIEGTGKIVRYLPALLQKDEPLQAQLKLRSNNLNLNEWIQEKGPVPGSVAEVDKVYSLSLPKWLNLEADARVGHFELAKFVADSLHGQISLRDHRLTIPEISMRTLSGEVQMALNMSTVADGAHAGVEMQVEARGIDIYKTLNAFDQLAAFALVRDNLSGEFSGNVFVKGVIDQRLLFDEESLVSYGKYEIRNGRLVNFKPLEGLAGFVKLEKLRDIRFSDVNSSYRVENKFVNLPDMVVKANDYTLNVYGRHGFDNSLDYHVAVELPKNEARKSKSQEVQSWIEEGEVDAIKVVIPIKVTGTVDNPKFSLDGKYVRNSVKKEIESQKEEIAEAFKKETEEYFGKQDNTNVQDWIIEEGKDTAQKPVPLLEKLKNPFVKRPKKPTTE